MRAGDLPAARAVIDIAVSVDAMQPFESVRRLILEQAALAPILRRELGLLNPAAVLAAADLVSQANRRHLFQPFVARVVNDEFDDERRRSAADALAPLATELTEDQRTQISTALQDESLQAKFPIYRHFAVEAPDLIPAEAVLAALTRAETPAVERTALSCRPPRRPGDRFGHPAGIRPRASAPRRAARTRLSSCPHRGTGAGGRTRARRRVPRWTRRGWVGVLLQLVQELAANWGAYPAADHGRLITFFSEFLPRADSDTQAQTPVNVLDLLFEDPDHALAVIDEFDPLPDSFRIAILDRLVAHASDPSHWQAGIAALTKLAGEEAGERIATVFIQLLAAGHLDAAAQVLAAEDSHLQPRIEALAERAAPYLQERVNSGDSLPVELFESLAEAMSPEQIASLAALIAARLRDGAPANVTELVAELRQRPKSRLRDFIVAHSLDLLVGTDSFTPELAPLLGAVCADVPRLESARQAQLATKLSEWLHAHPGQLSLLSQNILTIEDLAPNQRGFLVEGLLDTERATDGPVVRRELLERCLPPQRQSNRKPPPRYGSASAARSGNEIDQEIATEFAGRFANIQRLTCCFDRRRASESDGVASDASNTKSLRWGNKWGNMPHGFQPIST